MVQVKHHWVSTLGFQKFDGYYFLYKTTIVSTLSLINIQIYRYRCYKPLRSVLPNSPAPS